MNWIYKKLLGVLSRRFVAVLYRAILGRDVDAEGLRVYEAQLKKTGNLATVIEPLLASDEFAVRFFKTNAKKVADSAYLAVLSRRPMEHDAHAIQQLETDGSMEDLLRNLVESDELWRQSIRRHAEELSNQIQRAFLGRSPSDSAEEVARKIRAASSLEPLLLDLANCDELWRRLVSDRADQIVGAAFKGLLDQDLDETASTYVEQLKTQGDLAEVLSLIAGSDEHWQRTIKARSEDLVASIYRALLGRAPDQAALQDYGRELAKTHDLGKVMAAVAESDEHWLRLSASHIPEVLSSVYRGLLGREPDQQGLKAYSEVLRLRDGLRQVLVDVSTSPEFRSLAGTFSGKLAKPLVFIHIQKTAGTSFQNMLKELFGNRALCEHEDSLSTRNHASLKRYSAFAGHYNFDSLAHIPASPLNVVTFLRNPKKRLLSLYDFLKAHTPSASAWDKGMKLANELDIRSFFQYVLHEKESGFWNHMTWAIMGNSHWAQWRQELELICELDARRDFLEKEIRTSVRRRLREFTFVGFQEGFEISVKTMCEKVGLPPVTQVRHDHSLRQLTEEHPDFKKLEPTKAVSADVDLLIESLIEIDRIVYQEAENIFPNPSASSSTSSTGRTDEIKI